MKRRFATGLTAAAIFLAAPALAESPKPYPSFTFKRVKAPPKGTIGRITVQIDPEARRRWMAAMPTADSAMMQTAPETEKTASLPAPAHAPPAMDWYWSAISPKRADPEGRQLAAAVAHLKNAPAGKAVPAPRLQLLQAIATSHGPDILKATAGTRVSPALVLAIISVESAGRTDALSSAGAQGLMQLIPDTAARFGVQDATDATQNIRGGVAYLDWLMNEFDNDPLMVLAAYNAGENAVKSSDGVPPYAETRAYVPKVLAAWSVARRLCLTPPELISDGCVLAADRSPSDG